MSAAGQLAITEVQSAPSTTPMLRGADYWELTNFGDTPVDLADYWFTDDAGFPNPDAINLAAAAAQNQIAPLETMIFVRGVGAITTPAEFHQWWGESNLPSNLTIAVAPWNFGFSADRDAVQLWQKTSAGTNLIDRVELFDSDPGDTFTYDPETGLLDRFSAAGVNGAFQAAATTDVGSPGTTTGPIDLRWVESPTNTVGDGGSPVTLNARAVGLPRPRYQWLFNETAIPGATGPALSFANVTTADAGWYTVEVSNGLTNLLSSPAQLSVNTNPRCAAIVGPPTDLVVTPGQTACFTIEVRGYPVPSIRWEFNGQTIPGATGTTYEVTVGGVGPVGVYTVHVTNALCATNASASLDVIAPPALIMTEAMAFPSTNTAVPGHNDWWELTNTESYPVNLRGYRFDDSSRTLQGAVVVTNDMVLQPGSSVIWVSSMTPQEFKRWWGEENLPQGLQIISYPGNGFDSLGDRVLLWNATARSDDDVLFRRSVLDLNVPPTQGFSLEYDPEFGSFSIPSIAGERGAFQAAESDDVGSPGWTSNEQRAAPRYLSILRDGDGFVLRWKTEPGWTYAVQHRSDLAQAGWTTLTNLSAVESWFSFTNYPNTNVGRGFFRVGLQAPGP